jgi:hypothetical protein
MLRNWLRHCLLGPAGTIAAWFFRVVCVFVTAPSGERDGAVEQRWTIGWLQNDAIHASLLLLSISPFIFESLFLVEHSSALEGDTQRLLQFLVLAGLHIIGSSFRTESLATAGLPLSELQQMQHCTPSWAFSQQSLTSKSSTECADCHCIVTQEVGQAKMAHEPI